MIKEKKEWVIVGVLVIIIIGIFWVKVINAPFTVKDCIERGGQVGKCIVLYGNSTQ